MSKEEYFLETQEFKEKLENSIIFNLYKQRMLNYLGNPNSKENLIQNSKNTRVHRIGILDFDLPFILRIPKGYSSISPLESKFEVEVFCYNFDKFKTNKEKESLPRFCLPIKFYNLNFSDENNGICYAVLTQDMTNWGLNKFKELPIGFSESGSQERTIILPNGLEQEILIDFGPRSCPGHPVSHTSYSESNEEIIKYDQNGNFIYETGFTNDENCIDLTK